MEKQVGVPGLLSDQEAVQQVHRHHPNENPEEDRPNTIECRRGWQAIFAPGIVFRFGQKETHDERPGRNHEEGHEFEDRDLFHGAAVIRRRQPYLDDEREQEYLPQHRRRKGTSRRIVRPLAYRDRKFAEHLTEGHAENHGVEPPHDPMMSRRPSVDS